MTNLLNFFFLSLFNSCVSNNLIELNSSNFITIRNEINEDLISNAIFNISKIDNDEIYIYIYSNGGSVTSGNNFVQYMNGLKINNKVLTCIADKAMSMAFIIFQYCDNRYVLQNSILMQHQMSLTLSGNIENINSHYSLVKNINNNLITYQAKKIGMNEDSFRKMVISDWWIYGIDAVDKKVADKSVNLICNKELFNDFEYNEIEIFIGKIKLKYSKCPLIKNPVEIFIDNKNNFSNLELIKIKDDIYQKLKLGKIDYKL